MRVLATWLSVLAILLLLFMANAFGQQPADGVIGDRRIFQATLIAPGSPSFHLNAVITAQDDPDSKGEVEMFWVAPDKWRRTIKSQEFSQTLIVNRDKVFEQDSEDYFPLSLQTLV